jgi:hypothetical protein
MLGQRQSGQSQTGGPALGPLHQQPQRFVGQLDACRLEQRAGLVECEAKVARSNLCQLPRQS